MPLCVSPPFAIDREQRLVALARALRALDHDPSPALRLIAYVRADLTPVTEDEDAEALRRHQLRPVRPAVAPPAPSRAPRRVLLDLPDAAWDSLWLVFLLLAFLVCCLLVPAHAAERREPEPSALAGILVALIPCALAVAMVLATRPRRAEPDEGDAAHGDTTGFGGRER